MRAKIKILDDKETLIKAFPKNYADQTQINIDGPYGLIVLNFKVAKTNNIEKALGKLPKKCNPIIAVKEITLEANAFIRSIGGQAITLKSTFWREDRYERAKVHLGAKVKKPSI